MERETRSDRSPLLQPAWAAAAVVVAWGLELAIAKKLAHDGGSIAISVSWAVAAAALASLAADRPRSAVGGAVIASLALVAVAWGSDTGLYAALGIKCAVLELVAACIPFGVAVAAARRAGAPIEPWRASALAAAGAMAGHAALHLSCKVPHEGPHLLLFHFGGVLLAAVLAHGGARAFHPRSA
jgi:hypothetical protein